MIPLVVSQMSVLEPCFSIMLATAIMLLLSVISQILPEKQMTWPLY